MNKEDLETTKRKKLKMAWEKRERASKLPGSQGDKIFQDISNKHIGITYGVCWWWLLPLQDHLFGHNMKNIQFH